MDDFDMEKSQEIQRRCDETLNNPEAEKLLNSPMVRKLIQVLGPSLLAKIRNSSQDQILETMDKLEEFKKQINPEYVTYQERKEIREEMEETYKPKSLPWDERGWHPDDEMRS